MMQQSRAIPLYNVSLRKMRDETISTDQKKESKVRKRGLIDGVEGICEAVTMRHSIYRGQRPTQRQSFCSMVVRNSLVALLRYKGCSGNEFAAADALI